MPVFCRNCKKENPDPGQNLPWSSCRHCGGQLTRSKGVGRIAGAGLLALMGAEFGPIGAIIGGVLGFFVGDVFDKNI